MKATLVFIVHMGSATNDLSGAATKQAQLEYAAASKSPPALKVNIERSFTIGGSVAIGALALVTAVIFVVLALLRPWRPHPAVGDYMSPDGRYWWDGASWRAVDTDPPPR